LAARVIVLSGRVSSGKTTLGQSLVERYGCVHVKTQDLIRRALPDTPTERRALQVAGDDLDRRSKGAWVATELAKLAQVHPPDAIIVVDAIRIRAQINAIRRAFGSRVVHVHLTAPVKVLAQRYRTRSRAMRELSSYGALSENETERRVEELADKADVVIDTKKCSRDDVVVRAASHLGFYGRSYEPLVDVVVGGAYGSEGKGHIAAFIAPEYDVLVRVGGPNAGHTVFDTPPYTHHQLPSGTRRCEAKLVIGPGAVLDQEKLLNAPQPDEVRKVATVPLPPDVTRESGAYPPDAAAGKRVNCGAACEPLRLAVNA
jgi:adenylosuccinate synthase